MVVLRLLGRGTQGVSEHFRFASGGEELALVDGAGYTDIH